MPLSAPAGEAIMLQCFQTYPMARNEFPDPCIKNLSLKDGWGVK